jgi:hypothetical protein
LYLFANCRHNECSEILRVFLVVHGNNQARSQKITAEGAKLGNGGHKNEYSEREQLWLPIATPWLRAWQQQRPTVN